MRVHERLPSLSEDTVGVALVSLSAVCFGMLGISGVYAQQAGLSIPTLLAGRFALASVVVWALLAATGRVRLLRGRALATGLALGASASYAAYITVSRRLLRDTDPVV